MGNVENIDFRGSNVNLLRRTTFVEHINLLGCTGLAWLGLAYVIAHATLSMEDFVRLVGWKRQNRL